MEGRGTRSSFDNKFCDISGLGGGMRCDLLSVVIVKLCSGNICVCAQSSNNHNIAKNKLKVIFINI